VNVDTADLVRAGQRLAYDQVIILLDTEVTRFKDCGDFTTAEVIEILRAKVKAKSNLELGA
jgi:hypothetical protein